MLPRGDQYFFKSFHFKRKASHGEINFNAPNIFYLYLFVDLLRNKIHLFPSAFMSNNDWNEMHGRFLASEITVDFGAAVRVATILDWYEQFALPNGSQDIVFPAVKDNCLTEK